MKRLRNPLYWGVILAVCAIWTVVPWTFGLGDAHLHMVLSPLYGSLVILMIFPMPWQWSSDDRPLAPFPRGLAQALVWNAVWALALVSLTLVFHGKERPHPGHPPQVRPALPFNPKPILGGVSFMGLGLLIGWLLANKERAEAGEHEAMQAATEARMHVLQSQMNPHVLFNAISGLSEMVREEPEAAEQALLNLSGLLRDLLDYSARNSAPLSQERAMVERYLTLEQIRLGKRLRVTWDWDPTLEHRELPPLMLQPLVENALKHGIAPHREGGEVRIRLVRTPEAVELEVANTGAGLADPIQEGVGLRNLRERLSYFQPGATLTLSREGGWTRALLSLGRRS